MDYREMTAPCGLDCFNCTFFLAPEDPEAQSQIEQWAQSKAAEVRRVYFSTPWSLAE